MKKEKIIQIKQIACEEVYHDGKSSSQALTVVCPTFINKIVESKRVHPFYRQEKENNFSGYKKRKCKSCRAIEKIVGSV